MTGWMLYPWGPYYKLHLDSLEKKEPNITFSITQNYSLHDSLSWSAAKWLWCCCFLCCLHEYDIIDVFFTQTVLCNLKNRICSLYYYCPCSISFCVIKSRWNKAYVVKKYNVECYDEYREICKGKNVIIFNEWRR